MGEISSSCSTLSQLLDHCWLAQAPTELWLFCKQVLWERILELLFRRLFLSFLWLLSPLQNKVTFFSVT